MALAVLVERCHGRQIEHDGCRLRAVFGSPTITSSPAASLLCDADDAGTSAQRRPPARPGECRWWR
jgi:hypothetical protein